MISSEAWEQQIRDIEEEDDYMMHVYRNKIFPFAIYNLTDNGLFNNFSHTRKLKALKSIVDNDRDIRKKSLFYDQATNIVYFQSRYGIYHKFDIHNQRCHVMPFYKTSNN